jgi:hypothetical protein
MSGKKSTERGFNCKKQLHYKVDAAAAAWSYITYQ